MRTGIGVPGCPWQRDRRGARRDPGVPETGVEDSRTPESVGRRGRRRGKNRDCCLLGSGAGEETSGFGPAGPRCPRNRDCRVAHRDRCVPGDGTGQGDRRGPRQDRAVPYQRHRGHGDRAARGRPRRCRACRGSLSTGRDGGGTGGGVPPSPVSPPRTCPPPRRCHVRSLFSPQPRPTPSHWSAHDISDDVTRGTGDAAVHWGGSPVSGATRRGGAGFGQSEGRWAW